MADRFKGRGSGHALKHEGAVVVVDIGDGWFASRMLDGSVKIVKYTNANPHEWESPHTGCSLTPAQYSEMVEALGIPLDTVSNPATDPNG